MVTTRSGRVTNKNKAKAKAGPKKKKAAPKQKALVKKKAAPARGRGRSKITWVGKYVPPGEKNCKKVYRITTPGGQSSYFYNDYNKTNATKDVPCPNFKFYNTYRKYIPAGAYQPK